MSILINQSNKAINKETIMDYIAEQDDYKGCKLRYKGIFCGFKVYKITGYLKGALA